MKKTDYTTFDLTRMALSLALLIISAKLVIPIPFYDYISLQLVVIFLLNQILGCKKATLVIAAYVVLGVLGLPIFAAGGGFAYVLRPTFGFLISYVFLPALQTFFAEKLPIASRTPRLFLRNYLSLLFVHIFGFVYKLFIITSVLNTGQPIALLLSLSVFLDFAVDCLLIFAASSVELKLKGGMPQKAPAQ